MGRLTTRRYWVWGVAALILCGGIGILLLWRFSDKNWSPGDTSLISPSVVKKLPQKDASGMSLEHLDAGLNPPTNKWYSGAVLQKTPQPVFASPNSYRPTDSSIELSLPRVTASADTINAPHTADVTVAIPGSTSYKVTRYDELSLDLTYMNADKAPLAVVTIMAGSPYMWVEAKQDVQLTAALPGKVERKDSAVSAQTGAAQYGLKSEGSLDVSEGRATSSLAKGKLLAVYSAPDDAARARLAKAALQRVDGVQVEYREQGASEWKTTFRLAIRGGETYFALPPSQSTSSSDAASYSSLYGRLKLASGKDFSYTTPKVDLRSKLDLTRASKAEKDTIRAQLKKDVAATVFDKDDTYFAGKQLQRASQLILLADQLGEARLRQSLTERLRAEFDTWFDGGSDAKSFYYDSKIHGVVGNKASFGANEFNDHHFHYGYFLYAAAVLAQYDTSFVARHKDMVNLLAADIANYRSNETIPVRRYFDPYAGHSWASGASPFRDGNNQESSSEAVNAWTGAALWAQRSGNTALGRNAQWMLALETAAAKRDWLDVDVAGYKHSLVGINWGGKRDYATWFSAEPNAILAIQLLPLNPTMQQAYRETVRPELFRGTDTGRKFGDYILMAQALQTNSPTVFSDAKNLPDAAIDDGNSRSYLLAWIASLQ